MTNLGTTWILVLNGPYWPLNSMNILYKNKTHLKRKNKRLHFFNEITTKWWPLAKIFARANKALNQVRLQICWRILEMKHFIKIMLIKLPLYDHYMTIGSILWTFFSRERYIFNKMLNVASGIKYTVCLVRLLVLKCNSPDFTVWLFLSVVC